MVAVDKEETINRKEKSEKGEWKEVGLEKSENSQSPSPTASSSLAANRPNPDPPMLRSMKPPLSAAADHIIIINLMVQQQ